MTVSLYRKANYCRIHRIESIKYIFFILIRFGLMDMEYILLQIN